MINKTLWISASLCLLSLAVSAGELLGHISEDTAQPMSDAKPSQTDDRRIIYRVICSPEDEQLPDCEQPVIDNEAVIQPKVVEPAADEPELAQDQEPESISEPQQITKSGKTKAKAKKTTRKTKSSKKAKTTKKTDSKKASAKKPASKKKKH